MKKLMWCFIFVLFLQNLESQVVFCPPGAEWNYNFYWWWTGEITNETIKYKGDTVINQEAVKIITHKKFFRAGNRELVSRSFLKQKGDTVFVQSAATQNKWQILYNFAATAGQSWTIAVYRDFVSTPTSTYAINHQIVVDSVGYLNVNNVNLKRLYVRYSSMSGQNTITERFGCNDFMFNHRNNNADGDYFLSNLCYKDSSFGLKQFTGFSCDYTGKLSIAQNTYLNQHIKIYPQPTSDFLNVQFENGLPGEPVIMQITDLSGRNVKQLQLECENNKIEISELENGIYILHCMNNGKLIYAGKLVKE